MFWNVLLSRTLITQDPIYMMQMYFDQQDKSGRQQNVVIDGESFEYSPLFLKAADDAVAVKSQIRKFLK